MSPSRLLLTAGVLLLAAAVRASPDETVVRYLGGERGRVVFDPRVHQEAGTLCDDCHARLFPMRRTGLIGLAAHDQGTHCFGCHDGKRAFSDCARCHAGK